MKHILQFLGDMFRAEWNIAGIVITVVLLFIESTLLLTDSTVAEAQWSSDSTLNNPICTAAGNQELPQLVSDGRGGAMIAWQDERNGNWDIYSQKVDQFGDIRWTTNGIPICTADSDQVHPQLVSDGFGGAIIVWEDKRNGNWSIYSQRIDKSGNMLWTLNGVAICVADSDQEEFQVTSDGNGGAIVAWQDNRYGDWDIYCQRVDARGNLVWSSTGVAVCTADSDQTNPQIVSDGIGGAAIAWIDHRDGYHDIYAQRIGDGGNADWQRKNGIAVCTAAAGWAGVPKIVSDGSGGAIVTWLDYGRGGIYAQKIDQNGNLAWEANGNLVHHLYHSDYNPAAMEPVSMETISDGYNGAIVAWTFLLGSPNWDAISYLGQRIDENGEALWDTSGVVLASADLWWVIPGSFSIYNDGSGGILISNFKELPDSRYEVWNWTDIFVDRVALDGKLSWSLSACAANGPQFNPEIVGDDDGGAIVVWEDYRNGTLSNGDASDIYASRVVRGGSLNAKDTIPKGYELYQNYPNPFNMQATIQYDLPSSSQVIVTIYDVLGRKVETLVDEQQSAGTHQVTINGSKLPSGVYFYRLAAGNFIQTKKLVLVK